MVQDEQLSTAGGDEAHHHLDYAAESFWVSQDAELDWLDRNAVIDRKDSGKASLPPSSNGSNRFSGSIKTKPSIIGLPKPTKPNYRRPCKASSVRLFPKRTNSVGNNKSEPSSPKVSCMGRVRSRRGKSRRNKSAVQDTKPGFWNNFRAMFRPKSHDNGNNNSNDNSSSNNKTKNQKQKKKKREFESNEGTGGGAAEAPGLGGVKRFASARRSDGWASELEVNMSRDGAHTE
ncbi:hypothetical protein RND81_01G016100 [Saponaria officinalis]|uniref:Uncharacterized protein n=1 Tax=Saponaria officinalis TaxID=3572 RepID=A0AAW1N5J6_SAPOF